MIAAVLLLSYELLQLWYDSMLDMHLFNMYASIFSRSYPTLVFDLTPLTEIAASLLLSTGVVVGLYRLCRQGFSRWIAGSQSRRARSPSGDA